ncbi:MAG: polysaccharide deacetylase family protein [Akkermansia sp.]|nr:polysaccharide deacetylase family protein [Akkermansia sp.]
MKRAWAFLLSLCCAAVAVAQMPEPAPEKSPTTSEQQRSIVSVIGYDRIAAAGEHGGLTAEMFARHLDYLQRCGLTPISAERFLSWRAGQESLPPHAVLLSFDEADAAFEQEIFPLLQERRIPFLLFADERNLGSTTGRLAPDVLRGMQTEGASIGSATATRPADYEWLLASQNGESAQLAQRELGDFAESLRCLFGSCELFAYPGGEAQPALVSALPAYGFRAAFSRAAGKVTRSTPAFRLPRTMVHSDADFARAVNFGKESETTRILAVLSGQVAPEAEDDQTDRAPLKSLLDSLADDDEAEDPDEEVSSAFGAAPNLVRHGSGDWETARFTAPLVPREQTRVAVLGYHNFSNTKRVSEMRMRTSEFCCQMQYIRDAGLSVITMEDFLQWLRGERLLPERCVLITLDDGWKSVYTDAYPVLRAYGYPFTLFLYTRYIQVQGDSLTKAQLAEMAGQGATIGSHSTNHLYPKSWRRYDRNPEAYAQQVQSEIIASQGVLRAMVGNCSTYCYPGGYNTPPMLEALRASEYRAAFTVLPAKVTTEEDPYLVHRYMVFGNDPSIFRRAVNFDGEAGVRPTQEGIRAAESRARAFFPAAFPEAAPVADR